MNKRHVEAQLEEHVYFEITSHSMKYYWIQHNIYCTETYDVLTANIKFQKKNKIKNK